MNQEMFCLGTVYAFSVLDFWTEFGQYEWAKAGLPGAYVEPLCDLDAQELRKVILHRMCEVKVG